MIEDWETGQLF